jgi:type IV pilus assembly protein PilN
MIRINLLGTAKPKKGKRRFTMPKVTTDGPSPVFLGLGLLVFAGAGLYWDYSVLEKKHEKLQAQIKEADQNIASMVKVKQAFLERQKDYDAFKRRFDIIDQLRAGQVGPVPLLTNLSDTVTKTDGVWLLNMRDDGATVSMDGLALAPANLATLMTNLRKSGYYKNVELKDTQQEEGQKVQTFSFSLVCEKAKV